MWIKDLHQYLLGISQPTMLPITLIRIRPINSRVLYFFLFFALFFPKGFTLYYIKKKGKIKISLLYIKKEKKIKEL